MSKKKAAKKAETQPEMVLKEDYDVLVNQLQRLQAEFENFRKRVEDEKAQLSDFAQSKVIVELLPAVDNFGLALSSQGSNEDLKKGVEMIYAQFVDTLEKLGVTTIQTEDQMFDPRLHEALMSEEKEGVERNTIIQELQKGYMFKERVIRCAKVKVAK